MPKTWRISKPDPHKAGELSDALGVSPLISAVLLNRGVTCINEARSFLTCDLSGLHDPFLMKDMDKAVARIKSAIEKGEKITIWGDYDVDGITSVAVLKNTLKALGAYVTHYIPHRIEEGFGLNLTGAKALSKSGTNLIITVDCGVNSVNEVEFLKNEGIDAIITDHHKPKVDALPDAHALLNPLQPGCSYPFKYLAGVGVAFKLSCALYASFKGMSQDKAFSDLDITALGIISDIVPLVGENRILAKHGLKELTHTKKAGLAALKKLTGIGEKRLSTMHVGYILGPRLNASGRLGSAEASLQLLLAKSEDEAEELAKGLDTENKNRQKLGAKTLNEALARVDREVNFKSHRIIVLHQDDWHPGVIGIVASKIAERFMRPTILFSFKHNVGKGSGRSIANFHLFNAISECGHYLERFGGHNMACGMSIRRENLENFKEAINKHAEGALAVETITADIDIDAEMNLDHLNHSLVAKLEDLEPFGCENPQPIFCSKAVAIKTEPRTVGKSSIKMWVSGGKTPFETIGFQMADECADLQAGQKVDIAYTPSLRQWQGEEFVQLELRDVKLNGR